MSNLFKTAKMQDFPVSPDELMDRLVDSIANGTSDLIDEESEPPRIFHPDQGGTWIDYNENALISDAQLIAEDQARIARELAREAEERARKAEELAREEAQ